MSDDKYNKLIAIIESHKSLYDSIRNEARIETSVYEEGRIHAYKEILNEARIEIDGDES